ncbi:MAG TPA: hypothetical protein VGI80_06695 [Pyrinomonadaceae bacterium]
MTRIFSITAFCLFLSISTSAQQGLANKPPEALGPVKTITYKYSSVTFSRDKTRIDEGVSNGRDVVWLFTPQGRLLSSEIFERDGRDSGTKSLYNYDSTGRLTSVVHYLLGPLSITETFTYPSVRHVKITRVFEHPKDTVIEIDEYDQAGRIIKAIFQDDEPQTEFYKYDDKGNLQEFRAVDRSGKDLVTETYEYEFDSHGNWTKQMSKTVSRPEFGIPSSSTVDRQLTYY